MANMKIKITEQEGGHWIVIVDGIDGLWRHATPSDALEQARLYVRMREDLHIEWSPLYRSGFDDAARAIIADAREALGQNLGGYSILDLLADNVTGSVDDLRAVMDRIGETQ